jgi:hypothetical protein
MAFLWVPLYYIGTLKVEHPEHWAIIPWWITAIGGVGLFGLSFLISFLNACGIFEDDDEEKKDVE